MKASAPTKVVWISGLVLGILGLIGHFVTVPVLTPYCFSFLMAGFVLLALGTSFKWL